MAAIPAGPILADADDGARVGGHKHLVEAERGVIRRTAPLRLWVLGLRVLGLWVLRDRHHHGAPAMLRQRNRDDKHPLVPRLDPGGEV